MKYTSKLVVIMLALILAGCTNSQDQTTDNSGAAQIYIENKGSDTIVNLALAWAEEYQSLNPGFQISVTGGGSGTGIASLVNNTVDIANASRGIKEKEIENAQANGVEPLEFIIARDAIAVIVNPKNPVTDLTLEQISAIYTGEITNWQEVGGYDLPIVRLSRETNSGTHVYFLEEVLRLGDKENTALFSTNTLLLPSSEGIIREVSQNPNAIGYDGLGYITEEVKVLGIAGVNSDRYIFPSIETVNSGEYAIARNLYMYTNGEPAGPLAEYLDWILSPAAQDIVRDLGFVPIVQP